MLQDIAAALETLPAGSDSDEQRGQVWEGMEGHPQWQYDQQLLDKVRWTAGDKAGSRLAAPCCAAALPADRKPSGAHRPCCQLRLAPGAAPKPASVPPCFHSLPQVVSDRPIDQDDPAQERNLYWQIQAVDAVASALWALCRHWSHMEATIQAAVHYGELPRKGASGVRQYGAPAAAWQARGGHGIPSSRHATHRGTSAGALRLMQPTPSASPPQPHPTCAGGDADTVGAIAGALAGAQCGCAGLPQRWWTRLVQECTHELSGAQALEALAVHLAELDVRD